MREGGGGGGYWGGSHGFRKEQKGDDHPSPTECKEGTGWGGGGRERGDELYGVIRQI